MKLLVDLYDIFFVYEEERKCIEDVAGKDFGRCIECGCGTGRVSIPLAQKGWKVIAFDIDKDIIDIAKDKSEKLTNFNGYINFVVSDMNTTWPYNNGESDIVVMALNTILLCKSKHEQKKLIKEAFLSLRAGGRLIISVMLPSNFEQKPIERDPVIHNGKKIIRTSTTRIINKFGNFEVNYDVKVIDYSGKSKTYTARWVGTKVLHNELIEFARDIGFRHNSSSFGHGNFKISDEENTYVAVFIK